MGSKEIPGAANCLRAVIGESGGDDQTVFMLSFNVDDMTAEQIAFASERLFKAGALDVFTEAVGMKKSRPGTLISALTKAEDRDAVVKAAFRHTTTLGIRESECRRYVLKRDVAELSTPFGVVRKKIASGFGVERSKYEYEDIARVAREKGISLAEAVRLIEGR